ncbi:MAG TPA: HAD family hydrolase [Candidatus Hydrogenedentes bacterium]|nr:HAD family hydrolase [Candidatus Hydrogenedentota bacterium]
MSDRLASLKAHQPTKEFLIAIDSDGCVFDTMEIKQKECFIPTSCRLWHLQPVSKYARQAAEFVNLYSKWRGINRFPAIVKVFDLLGEWDKVIERGFTPPEVPNLRRWIETESKLGNPVLEAYCSQHDHPDMHKALKWSKAVNEAVANVVQGGLPPFPYARESIEKAQEHADLLVCSQTPSEALLREWQEQGLDQHVFAIAGQELGTKGEHIAYASSDNRYDKTKMLMIGDALGDKKAADQNDAMFYPINPGDEEGSWERFHDEALDGFFAGTYAGEYEQSLMTDFMHHLPETPPWKK